METIQPEKLEEQLTKGICARIMATIPAETDDIYSSKPVLQMLSIKKVASDSTTTAQTDRYRVILSDGVHFVQSMLATQLNGLVEKDLIGRNALIRLDRFTVNFVQKKRRVPISSFVRFK
jgi:replication factor A1